MAEARSTCCNVTAPEKARKRPTTRAAGRRASRFNGAGSKDPVVTGQQFRGTLRELASMGPGRTTRLWLVPLMPLVK